LTLVGFCSFAVLFHNPTQSASHAFSERIHHVISGHRQGDVRNPGHISWSGRFAARKKTSHGSVYSCASGQQVAADCHADGGRDFGTGGAIALACTPDTVAVAVDSSALFTRGGTEFQHFVVWLLLRIFAASFLLSVVLDGEYTAPMACYVALMLKVLISNWPSLRPYRLNLMWTMGEFGRMHWKLQHNLLLSDPLPWARLLTILSITLGMLALAARITQKQDF
jgi:hypothetical protein